MIDDELYVLATQELNSDNRREELWSRARALASDDHDEARYLYTNLRVEEMVQARKRTELNQVGDQTGNQAEKQTTSGSTDVPVSEPGSRRIADEVDPSELKFENTLEPKTTAGSDTSWVKRETNSAIERAADGSATRQSLPSTSDSDTPTLGDNSLRTTPLAPPRVKHQTRFYIDGDGTMSPDSMDLLNRTEPEGFDENDNSLDLTAPENLPAVHIESLNASDHLSASAAHEQGASADIDPDLTGPISDDLLPNELAYGKEISDDANPGDNLNATQSTNEFDSANKARIDRFDEPIEPPLHAGKAFTVLKHIDGNRQAIKLGNSWPALLFTVPWLLYKKLWGTAIVYLILGGVLVFALASTGFGLIDAGADATLQQKLIFAAFVLLAIIGLLYVPFRQGNRWITERLERKGFNHYSDLNAQTAKDALDLARE